MEIMGPSFAALFLLMRLYVAELREAEWFVLRGATEDIHVGTNRQIFDQLFLERLPYPLPTAKNRDSARDQQHSISDNTHDYYFALAPSDREFFRCFSSFGICFRNYHSIKSMAEH